MGRVKCVEVFLTVYRARPTAETRHTHDAMEVETRQSDRRTVQGVTASRACVRAGMCAHVTQSPQCLEISSVDTCWSNRVVLIASRISYQRRDTTRIASRRSESTSLRSIRVRVTQLLELQQFAGHSSSAAACGTCFRYSRGNSECVGNMLHSHVHTHVYTNTHLHTNSTHVCVHA